MNNKKELTMQFIDELEQSYSETSEVILNIKTPNGEQEAIVYIDKFFSPKKIDKCVKELIQKVDYLKTVVPKSKNMKDIMQLWLVLLIVRNFSSLDIPFEFKKQIAVLEKLTDTNILFQIYSQFETKEIVKVMDELERITEIIQKRIDENIEEITTIEKDLKSLNDLESIKKESFIKE